MQTQTNTRHQPGDRWSVDGGELYMKRDGSVTAYAMPPRRPGMPRTRQNIGTFRNSTEAREALRREQNKGTLRAVKRENPYFLDWATEVFTVKHEVSDQTRTVYLKRLNEKALKPIHYLRLRDISANTIRDLILAPMKAQRPPLAPLTISNRLSTIRIPLDYAVDADYISRNPMIELTKRDRPKYTRKGGPKVPVFTSEDIVEIHRLCAESRTPSYGDYWLSLLFTASRPNEPLGWWWEDIDFENGVIHCRFQRAKLERQNDPWQRVPLKTDEQRDVDLSAVHREILLRRYNQFPHGPEDWVYQDVNYRYFCEFLRRHRSKLGKKFDGGLGDLPLTPYKTRHNSLTQASKVMPMAELIKQSGNTADTLRKYYMLGEEGRGKLGAALDDVWGEVLGG